MKMTIIWMIPIITIVFWLLLRMSNRERKTNYAEAALAELQARREMKRPYLNVTWNEKTGEIINSEIYEA